MHYFIMRIQDKTRFIIDDRITLLTELQSPVQLKSVPVCLTMCFGYECKQNSRHAQSLAHSKLALTLWMPQGRVMGSIQFEYVTMLEKKLVGQSRSISSPILGWRYFRLTTSSILYEKIGCLLRDRILRTSPCGMPSLLPTSFYARPPRQLIPCWSHQIRQ